MTWWVDRAIVLSAMLMPMVMGWSTWATARLVDHGDRLARIERGELESLRRFEAIERALLRIEAKIDQLRKP